MNGIKLTAALVGGFIFLTNKYSVEEVPVTHTYVIPEEEVVAEEIEYELPPIEVDEDGFVKLTDLGEYIPEETSEEIEVTADVVDEIEEEVEVPTDEVEVLTNLVYGEGGGIKEDSHVAAIAWCVINRYEAGGYGDSIIEVATAKNQFYGYVPGRVVTGELEIESYNRCKRIVEDVLDRYYNNKEGRTLPEDYLWFRGDGKENYFRNEYKSTDYWDWSLPDPYVEG